MKAPEEITKAARRDIRYILFALRDGNTDIPTHMEHLVKPVRDYYSEQENFTGWSDFCTGWDIGTDDSVVLNNWEDSSRHMKWYTWGIAKTQVVKHLGLPTAFNEEEGIQRTFGSPIEFMVAIGYARISKNGKYALDVQRLMGESKTRTQWPSIVETDFSLADSVSWNQPFTQPDINISEV